MADGFRALPGAIQVSENRWYNRDNDNNYQYQHLHPVLMLHTVEGRMGREAIAGHTSPPHLWGDPLPNYRDIFQTVDLQEPARALRNIEGYAPQTNRRGIMIQVELQLYADPRLRGTERHVSSLTDDDLRWIGELVVLIDQQVMAMDPYGRSVIPDTPDAIPPMGPGDSGYGLGSEWRLGWPEFRDYRGGILTHAHSPDDAHYDTSGDFDIRRMAEWAIALKAGGAASAPAFVVLRQGMSGPLVTGWQALLNLVFGKRLVEDGIFGPISTEETRSVEEDLIEAEVYEGRVDGVVDQALADVVGEIKAGQDAGDLPRPWRWAAPAPPIVAPPAGTAPELVEARQRIEELLSTLATVRGSAAGIVAAIDGD